MSGKAVGVGVKVGSGVDVGAGVLVGVAEGCGVTSGVGDGGTHAASRNNQPKTIRITFFCARIVML